jgi:hypothetical protein
MLTGLFLCVRSPNKRLTAFHTPDGIYCWNRLLMGAKPSSAVPQSAYLKALDQYIDYDENERLRRCLLDESGDRLLDKEGNPKTLRHKFAVYFTAMTLQRELKLLRNFINYLRHCFVHVPRQAYR